MADLFSKSLTTEERNLAWNMTKFQFNDRLDEMEGIITSLNDHITTLYRLLDELKESVEKEREYRALPWWQRFWLWLTNR